MTRKITVLFFGGFLIIMLILTFTSKQLHQSHLPKVEVICPEQVSFQKKNVLDEKKSIQIGLALPKDICSRKCLFIISVETVNGEERTIAREVQGLTLGLQDDTYYEVIEGIDFDSKVIKTELDQLRDGDEVLIGE